MKNAFKFGFLAFAISVSMVACKGSGSASSADSATDSVAVDTTVKVDSAAVDTTVKVDSAAVDTTKKM